MVREDFPELKLMHSEGCVELARYGAEAGDDVRHAKMYAHDIIGDLNSRRGLVNGMDQRANARVIDAQVPLANMFGYVNTLRSLSQGRAQFTMVFDHYAEVPKDIAEKVKAKNA